MFEQFGTLIKQAEQRMAGLPGLEAKIEEIDKSVKEEVAKV